MFRKFAPAVLGLALTLSLSPRAQAQFDIPDFYVAAGAGGAILEPFDIDELGTATTFETFPFPGYALSGAAGLDFGLIRLEGEVFFNRYALNDFEVGGVDNPADGSFDTLAGMANVFVDLPLAVVTPFVGGGVGYGDVNANDLEFGGVPLLDDSDSSFVYQLRAGFAFPLLPLTDMTLGYRYFVTEDLEMSNANGKVELEALKSHIFELGLRFSF